VPTSTQTRASERHSHNLTREGTPMDHNEPDDGDLIPSISGRTVPNQERKRIVPSAEYAMPFSMCLYVLIPPLKYRSNDAASVSRSGFSLIQALLTG
jgi:hypothetical protein